MKFVTSSDDTRHFLIMATLSFAMVSFAGCASVKNVPIPPSPASYSQSQRQVMCQQHQIVRHEGLLVLPDSWEYHGQHHSRGEVTPSLVMFEKSREHYEMGLQWENNLFWYYAVAGGVGVASLGAGIGDLATSGPDAGLPLALDGALIGFGVGMIATAIYVHFQMPENPIHTLDTVYNAALCEGISTPAKAATTTPPAQ